MQQLRFSRYFKSLIIIGDIVVFAAVFLTFYLRRTNFKIATENYETNLLSLLVLIFFWLLLSGRTRIYSVPRTQTYTRYLERLLTHIVFFILGLFLLGKVIDNPLFNENKFVIAITLLVLLFFLKSLQFFFLKYFRSKGINHRNVMFLGSGTSLQILRETLTKRKDYGYRVFDFPEENFTIDELRQFWEKEGIHTVFITTDHSFGQQMDNEIFRLAEDIKVRMVMIPRLIQNKFFSHELSFIESQPILTPTKYPLDFYSNAIIKRVFDIVFSLLFLILIGSWLFPIIALFIKLNSSGPVFFIQRRFGYREEVFNCIKFRTMHQNGDSEHKTTAKDDPRVTSFGRFLRKTSLDETPQFINVLLGHMSIVGPRPHMLLVDTFYKPKISRYSVRSLVKPGITGLAQVNGLRGDKGNMETEMGKRVFADSFYVKNWSFMMDVIIILKTVVLIFEGDKNAY